MDQRTLAAAGGPEDQPNCERRLSVGRLDSRLPEPDDLGQAVAVPRAGHQLEEKRLVLGGERPQPLGDDLRQPVAPGRRAELSSMKVRVASQSLQVIGQVGRGLVAVGHPLRQAFQTDPLQLARHGAIELPRRLRLAVNDLLEDLFAVVAR